MDQVKILPSVVVCSSGWFASMSASKSSIIVDEASGVDRSLRLVLFLTIDFEQSFIIVEEANGVDSPAGTSGFFEMGVDISEFSYSP